MMTNKNRAFRNAVMAGMLLAGLSIINLGKKMTSRQVLPLLLLVTLSCGEDVHSPVDLPPGSGLLPAARIVLRLSDTGRLEAMTDQPDDVRQVTVSLWYPAAAPIIAGRYVSDLAMLGATLGSGRTKAFGLVRSPVHEGGPPASDGAPWPVLVLSHGNDMLSAQYSTLILDLVSHGFVVAAIDHPYDASAVLMSDGRVAGFGERQWPPLPMPDPTGKFAEDSPHARFYKDRVGTRAGDARFVLDQLASLDVASVAGGLAGKLDLARVGFLGHSVGGVAAGEVCQSDTRVKACLNLDGDSGNGPFYLRDAATAFNQPYLMLTKTLDLPDAVLAKWGLTRPQWLAQLKDHHDRYFGSITGGSHRILVAGATHSSFSDDPFVLAAMKGEAAADHRRRIDVVRRYTLAFFAKHLKNQPAPLLDGVASDPDVIIERWPSR